MRDLVVLPSSSPQQQREYAVTPAGIKYVPNSSPSSDLPSPAELFDNNFNHRLKSGSNAVAVPRDALVGFQNVSGLVQQNQFNIENEEEDAAAREEPQIKASPKRRRPKAMKTVGNDGKANREKDVDTEGTRLTKMKPRRKGKAESGVNAAECANGPKKEELYDGGAEEPVQPRADRTEVEAKGTKRKRKQADNSKIAAIQEAGEGTTRDGEQKQQKPARKPRKKTGTTSTHFGLESANEVTGIQQQGAGTECRTLIPQVVRRRMDWTPVKDTEASKKPLSEHDIYDVPQSSPKVDIGISQPKFSNLLEEYGYDKTQPTVSPECDSAPNVAFSKRRRLELVETTASKIAVTITTEDTETVAQPKKPLSKKKGWSITKMVTEKYQPVRPDSVATAAASEYFAPRANSPVKTISPSKKPAKSDAKPPAKPRAKRTKKAKAGDETAKLQKNVAKSKKANPAGQKLLSPSAQARKVIEQNLLFGTSSQLLSNHSPQFLGDLQHALKKSEAEIILEQKVPTSSPLEFTTGRAIRRKGGGMWTEAAVPVEEEAVTSDGFHFLSPVVKRGFLGFSNDGEANGPNARGSVTSPFEKPQSMVHTSDWNMIDDYSPNQGSAGFTIALSAETQKPSAYSSVTASAKDGCQQSVPIPSIASPSRPRVFTAPQMSAQTERAALRNLSTNTTSPTKVKSGASLGTPPRKTKVAKSSTKAVADKVVKPKKPRGRPAKTKIDEADALAKASGGSLPLQATPTKAKVRNGSQKWVHIDEIEDSEPDMTPSPPRRRGRKGSSSQLPDLVSSEAVSKRVNTSVASASHPHWPEIQAILFPKITTIVKASPKTANARKPSWYEKMLMYDPIVIEDLVAWLNEQGVRIEVREREVEVMPWMVQKWCEENSVCCLWREGLRGGVKTRY